MVLRIDSPGGSTFASEVIRREVDALQGGRQARGRLDEHPGGLRRLLHRDGRRPHRREPGDAHRLDRHLRDVPDVPALAGAGRRARRRRRHDGTVRRVQPRAPDERADAGTSCSRASSTSTSASSRTWRKSRKQDVAAIDAIAQGRVWSGADAKRPRPRRRARRLPGCDRAGGEARQARRGLRRRVSRRRGGLRRGAGLQGPGDGRRRSSRRCCRRARCRSCHAACNRSWRSWTASIGCATRATSTCTASRARSSSSRG